MTKIMDNILKLSLFVILFQFVLQIVSARQIIKELTPEDTVQLTEAFNTVGLSRKSFPEGFIFGTATSAYQVEGMTDKAGRGPCIWDIFIKERGVAGGANASVTVDQYHKYKDDMDMLKSQNFDSYRFSISWSRIFPNGTGYVNQEGVDYYHRLIDYMLEKGILPIANLYHYDLPQALEDRYLGWLDRKVVTDFGAYAEFCFKTYGDKVKNWMTMNEPRVVAALGYCSGEHAPGRCSKPYGNCTAGNSGTEPYIVGHHLLLSHATAVKIYREKYQDKQKGRIGILLDFVWYEALTRGLQDEYAAQRARDFHLGWYMDPITYGQYPKTMQEIVGDRLPKFTEEEIQMVKGSIDYVGINQYTTYFIYDDPSKYHPKVLAYSVDWHASFAYAKNGVPIGRHEHSAWLYNVPWGLYKAITYVKERYQNPTMLLSENGMDDPGSVTLVNGVNDTERVKYYTTYISELKRAIDDGANVIGYYAWSLLDNFEWTLGYTSRFGISYVEWSTLKRYPKMSAYMFQQLCNKTV